MTNGKHTTDAKGKRKNLKSKKTSRSKNINLLTIIFFIIFVISGYKLSKWYVDNQKTKKSIADIKKNIITSVETKSDNINSFNITVDFEKLKSDQKHCERLKITGKHMMPHFNSAM